MAKVKISDFLKKIGIKLEDEIDIAEEQTVDVNKDKNLNNVEDVEDKTNEDIKEEVKTMGVKYDEKTGLFTGLSDMEDGEMKTLLTGVNKSVRARVNQSKIDSAIKTKVDSLNLIDGVTSDVVIKLLDTTGIKVDGDAVVGVDDAFATLMKAQAGLFKTVDENKEEPSPVLEGFSKPMAKDTPFNMNDVESYAYGQ